jgi:hypothetical protein
VVPGQLAEVAEVDGMANRDTSELEDEDARVVEQPGDKAICMTLFIGCLVAQVFGGPGAGQHGFQAVGRTGADFIAIYPPQMHTVQWPPATALDDTTLMTFAHPLAALTGP